MRIFGFHETIFVFRAIFLAYVQKAFSYFPKETSILDGTNCMAPLVYLGLLCHTRSFVPKLRRLHSFKYSIIHGEVVMNYKLIIIQFNDPFCALCQMMQIPMSFNLTDVTPIVSYILHGVIYTRNTFNLKLLGMFIIYLHRFHIPSYSG
jgi:hypothetical protein